MSPFVLRVSMALTTKLAFRHNMSYFVCCWLQSLPWADCGRPIGFTCFTCERWSICN